MAGILGRVSSVLLSEALAPLVEDPARSAILLDIDGTLAPIVEQASEASVPEGTRHQLIAISRKYGLVACVSGRRASEARAMVAIGSITYLGSHGAELLRGGWTEAELDPGLREWTRRISAFTAGVDDTELRRNRVRVEDKGAITGFHWRGAPDEDAARSLVEAIAKRAESDGLATHWGRKVLEVRPPVQFDKGSGIVKLLAGRDITSALYAGDDVTDLDAFSALRMLVADGELGQAVCVGVKSEDGPPEIPAEADVVIEGTYGMSSLLGALMA
jgi:trehalose 6-phosphate phosphatase